jgi:hypothetical protein
MLLLLLLLLQGAAAAPGARPQAHGGTAALQAHGEDPLNGSLAAVAHTAAHCDCKYSVSALGSSV